MNASRSLRSRVRRADDRCALGVRVAALMALVLLITGAGACVEYRTIRWGAPAPELQESIFDNRAVRRADTPFVFARAANERTDLDTITVRTSDGRSISWGEHLAAGRIRAFIVVRNDTILYERYRDGYTDSTRSGSYSLAKSITSSLLGIALGDGTVRSLDDSVIRYVPELSANPAYEGVTLRHLIEMRSGFAYSRAGGGLWHDLRSDDARFYYTSNLNRELARMERAEPPDSRWDYKDSDPQILALVLTRATGQSLSEQLEQRVWRRIGAEFDASWSLDRRGGMEKASTGVNATARDYARFARLYLNGGAWNGEQIVPRGWVERSTTLDATRTEPEVWTWWRMQHRTLWWIPMLNWTVERDFFADGAKGQRLYVHPPSGTIIVQLADSDAQDFPFRRITYYFLDELYEYPVRQP